MLIKQIKQEKSEVQQGAAEKLQEAETVNDHHKAVFSRHNKALAHMNSQ